MSQEPDINELVQRIERLESKLNLIYIPNADEVLESLIEGLDSKTLQFILRHVDAKPLVLAMMGFKPKALAQVKGALSHKSWKMLADDLDYHMRGEVWVETVKEARRLIASVILQLQEMGEIVISRPDLGPYWDTAKRLKIIQEENRRRAQKVEGLEAWKKDVFDNLDRS